MALARDRQALGARDARLQVRAAWRLPEPEVWPARPVYQQLLVES
jgi:hypothetical protein